jgi:hypothetical protein
LAAKKEPADAKHEGKPGKETGQALGTVARYAVLAPEFIKPLTAADRAHALPT